MTTAIEYRKRADAIGKRLGRRKSPATNPMAKKQKALNDMANNEDWLAGKMKPKLS